MEQGKGRGGKEIKRTKRMVRGREEGKAMGKGRKGGEKKENRIQKIDR